MTPTIKSSTQRKQDLRKALCKGLKKDVLKALRKDSKKVAKMLNN